jgi:hypothetical protein
MDYHLEPARYEKVVMTKLMARYELRMNCDWISQLQTALEVPANIVGAAGSKQISIEAMRAALCTGEGFYNATAFTAPASNSPDGGTTVIDPISVQWAELIDVILRNTAWAAVANSAATSESGAASRNVQQSKVNDDMLYSLNVSAGSTLVEAKSTDNQGRDVLGIKAMVVQTPYDKEKLGDLLNNTNVGEVLGKMRNHGCFIKDEDQSKFVVNPFVQEALSGDASHNQDTQTLLDKDDELVFPINLKSIVGHTADGANEEISTTGFELEINIVFKQNNSDAPADSDDAHHSDVTGVSTAVPAPASSANVV